MGSTIEEVTSIQTAGRTCDEILTVEQVANRLQLKTSWVYAHADELGAYRAGKYLRFRWHRVLERLERAPVDVAKERAMGSSIGAARARKA